MIILKYYINKQQIEVNKSISNRLGKGKEGTVYKFKDKAIKIYKMKKGEIRCFPQRVNYEKTLEISHLKLCRLNKPIDIVTNEYDQFCGHTMDLISGSGNVLEMDTNTFLKELGLLENDAKILTIAFFRMKDIHRKNILVNDKINILDCNSYEQVNKTIRKNGCKILKDDLIYNYNCINKAIIDLLSIESKNLLLKNQKQTIYSIYQLLCSELVSSPYDYIGHFFERELLDRFESPKMYIKYKINNS